MKHRLPILSAVALGILGAVAAGFLTAHSSRAGGQGSEAPAFAARAPGAESAPPTVPQTSAATANPATEMPPAAELVRRCLDQLALFDSLSVKLRCHSHLFDQSIDGSGLYLQAGHAPAHLRLELKMALGDDVCTLQQVCDGSALWTRRTLQKGVRLGRVDVPRALAARQARLAAGTQTTGAPTADLALGGLPMLVDGVRRSFDLQLVRPARVGKTPVYMISGTLQPAMLAQLLADDKGTANADQPAKLSDLPEQAPTHVDLCVGREDFFPYKIDFKRIVDGKSDPDLVSPITSIEFYDVQRNIALDPVQFVYVPGEAAMEDTDIYNSRQ